MKITLIAIGKLKNSDFEPLFLKYCSRMNWRIDTHEIVPKSFKQISDVIAYEESQILQILESTQGAIIVLDETGIHCDSLAFSKMLSGIQNDYLGRATFIIGGAYGLTEALKKRSTYCLSLGKMTWPHLLVRVLLVEQLYRAKCILERHPYHKS